MPVGTLEEMLVEKIKVCWWREKRALRREAGLIEREFVPVPDPPPDPFAEETVRAFGTDFRPRKIPELEEIKDHLRLPLGQGLDRILRYEAAMERQMAYAINQLERLQRARKGEHVPAPVNVQLSSDQ